MTGNVLIGCTYNQKALAAAVGRGKCVARHRTPPFGKGDKGDFSLALAGFPVKSQSSVQPLPFQPPPTIPACPRHSRESGNPSAISRYKPSTPQTPDSDPCRSDDGPTQHPVTLTLPPFHSGLHLSTIHITQHLQTLARTQSPTQTSRRMSQNVPVCLKTKKLQPFRQAMNCLSHARRRSRSRTRPRPIPESP